MSHTLAKISDFIIKVIMMFTTLVALVFFIGYYKMSALIFTFLALLLVIAIVTKGLFDIFSKD